MNDEQQGPTSVVLLQGGTYVTEVSVKTEMALYCGMLFAK